MLMLYNETDAAVIRTVPLAALEPALAAFLSTNMREYFTQV